MHMTCPHCETKVYYSQKACGCSPENPRQLNLDIDDQGGPTRRSEENLYMQLPAPGRYSLSIQLFSGPPVPFKIQVHRTGHPLTVYKLQPHADTSEDKPMMHIFDAVVDDQGIIAKLDSVHAFVEIPEIPAVTSEEESQPSAGAGTEGGSKLGEESLASGIQAAFLLHAFPKLVVAKAPRGLGFGVEADAMRTFRNLGGKLFLPSPDGWGSKTRCPRDGEMGCSYVDTLKKPHRGKATHFVSWCWNYTLKQVTGALAKLCQPSDQCIVYFWMCFFCNNQYRIDKEKTSFDELRATFQDNLQRIGKMIIIMDDYIQPKYVTRVWCIYETFLAIEQGLPHEFTLPASARDQLKDRIAQGESLPALKSGFKSIDAEKATAEKKEDREKIKELIRKGVGFEKVNEAYLQLVRS